MATGRTALVAGVCAAVGVAVPGGVVAMAGLRLPDGVAWGWVAANAVFWSAVAFVIAPVAGIGLAGGVTLVFYFAVGALHNLAPEAGALVPVTAYPGPDGHWVAALVLGAVAVIVHARTRGSTSWAQRMFARDD